VLLLFPESTLKEFTSHPVTDTTQSSEFMLSFDAESPAEVNEIAQKVTDAGGNVFAKPGEKDGWMYGCGFADLDGHRWNILYMDVAKMPK